MPDQKIPLFRLSLAKLLGLGFAFYQHFGYLPFLRLHYLNVGNCHLLMHLVIFYLKLLAHLPLLQ